MVSSVLRNSEGRERRVRFSATSNRLGKSTVCFGSSGSRVVLKDGLPQCRSFAELDGLGNGWLKHLDAASEGLFNLGEYLAGVDRAGVARGDEPTNGKRRVYFTAHVFNGR